jgi:hypothetical protein
LNFIGLSQKEGFLAKPNISSFWLTLLEILDHFALFFRKIRSSGCGLTSFLEKIYSSIWIINPLGMEG